MKIPLIYGGFFCLVIGRGTFGVPYGVGLKRLAKCLSRNLLDFAYGSRCARYMFEESDMEGIFLLAANNCFWEVLFSL